MVILIPNLFKKFSHLLTSHKTLTFIWIFSSLIYISKTINFFCFLYVDYILLHILKCTTNAYFWLRGNFPMMGYSGSSGCRFDERWLNWWEELSWRWQRLFLAIFYETPAKAFLYIDILRAPVWTTILETLIFCSSN